MSLEPIIHASPAIQIHLAAALAAFLAGLFIFTRRKGDVVHRAAGVIFVTLLLATALSALFITGLMEMFGPQWKGWYSPIHLLIPLTLLGLLAAVRAILRGDVATHRKEMRGLFFGALLFAGALAFIPERVLWRVFFP